MIEINNITTTVIDDEFLRKIAEKVLEEEKKKKIRLSIALVGQARMRKINKRYRGKNRVTDVLSFPSSKILMEKFKIGNIKKIEGLGEIIICIREVKKNAKRIKSSFEKELAQVLIHGILHLLGYDHEKSEIKAKEMERKQNYYLLKVLKS
jgi:rRNA maturation RNase YbeY